MSRSGSTDEIDETIASDQAAGNAVIDRVLKRLAAHQWEGRDYFGIHLALQEAVDNAIKHGNGFDKNKQVHILCQISAASVRIQVTDQGNGFDPNAVADCTDEDHIELPCGRGVLLMKNFMNHVEYNDRGNVVIMEKTRAAAN